MLLPLISQRQRDSGVGLKEYYLDVKKDPVKYEGILDRKRSNRHKWTSEKAKAKKIGKYICYKKLFI